MGHLAIRLYALISLKADGKSKISRIEAAVHVLPMSKAAADWRTVACADGKLLTVTILLMGGA